MSSVNAILQSRPASASAGADVYTVRPGDTLSAIAERNNTTVDAILAVNRQITNPDLIRPGQTLTLPQGAAPASHTVRAGESLSGIADQYGLSWRDLAAHNGISNPALIHPGQQIRLGAGADAGPSTGTRPANDAAPATATPSRPDAASPGAVTPGAVTGALPSTEGMTGAQRFQTYSAYVNAHGDAQAKADLAAGRQVILGLRNETAIGANGGRGAYDDRVVVLQGNSAGGTAREYAANTEPSGQYEGRFGQDFNGDGRRELGRITEGTVRFERGTSANLGNVLRPTELHQVSRDTNHDGVIDGRDPGGTARNGDYSFLFHAGGNSNTGSAGCQTMKPGDYQSFWNGLGTQSQFSYVLVNVDRHAAHGAPAPAPGGDRPAAGGLNPDIGALSTQYETGGRGPGTVSSGSGDPGGVSYGSYQLAGNRGRPQEFLTNEGRRWAGEFAGTSPGSANFTAAWRAIAAREPEAFQAAQHDFIQRTHFDVQAGVIQRAGLDVSTRSHALQDVVWSTSVQHGPQTQAVTRAMAAVSAQGIDAGSPQYDRALINAIYDERGRRNGNGELAYFSSARADVQAGVANRFVNERADALNMLEGR